MRVIFVLTIDSLSLLNTDKLPPSRPFPDLSVQSQESSCQETLQRGGLEGSKFEFTFKSFMKWNIVLGNGSKINDNHKDERSVQSSKVDF